MNVSAHEKLGFYEICLNTYHYWWIQENLILTNTKSQSNEGQGAVYANIVSYEEQRETTDFVLCVL